MTYHTPKRIEYQSSTKISGIHTRTDEYIENGCGTTTGSGMTACSTMTMWSGMTNTSSSATSAHEERRINGGYTVDGTALTAALETVADNLEWPGRDAEEEGLVTVGGNPHSLDLRKYDLCEFVYFFPKHRHSRYADKISKAANIAYKKNPNSLRVDWCGPPEQLEQQDKIFKEAKEEGNVLFESKKGLVVYSAPLKYAFCFKLQRYALWSESPNDWSDALDLLRKIFKPSYGYCPHFDKHRIQEWCDEYNLTCPLDDAERIAEAFHSQVDLPMMAMAAE